jgi:hypothetical protein
MAKEEKTSARRAAGDEAGRMAAPTVNWDDSAMKTSYANVVNAAGTREELTLFFGTNQTWNPVGKDRFHVSLSDRIVLNPFAAKRLWTLLGAVLHEYENRFGTLSLDAGTGAASGASATPAEAGRVPTKKADDPADA